MVRNSASSSVLVYGSFPGYGSLFFDTLHSACASLQNALARGTAKTWGDYMLLDPDGAEQDAEIYLNDAIFHGFLDYCVAYRDRFGALDLADARKRYGDLHPGHRPPIPSDPFDQSELVEQKLEYGMLDMPSVEMTHVLPREILDRFAEVGDGIWDGPHSTIDPALEHQVVQALREHGYQVIRDDVLMSYSIDYDAVDPDTVLALMMDPVYRGMALPESAVGYDEEQDEWGVFD